MSEATDARDFDGLLEYLKQTRGFDFSAYKRASLMRRVQKRMHSVNCDRFVDYTDYLEVHPDEFGHLFNVILINVTAFFRDDTAWDYLRDTVVPGILDQSDGQPVRLWSAGCASGEEAYSIAMVLAEALGRDQFRDRVKIYATDVDDRALAQARQATFTDRDVQAVPPALVERYFVQDGDRFVFDRDLRRSVVFGHHDLIQDAPISRVNLLVCRNTLMYFNTEMQSQILARFHFALADAGVLFLGNAEMLLTHSQLFSPMDLRCRIFRKVSKDDWRDRMAIMTQAKAEATTAAGNHNAISAAAVESGPHAQIAIVTPADVSRVQELESQLARSKQDLETAYAELRSTNEELETTNDELQSTVEELEATNQALQSTNEALETMNAELQSAHQELHTMNDELRERSDDLSRSNALFESILTGVRAGVIVVDRELRVTAWNHRSEDLWGLRRDEVKGQNFLNLDIGLPVEELRGAIRSCFAGDPDHLETHVRATNRRGRCIDCRISVTPLVRDPRRVTGVILMIDEQPADVRAGVI